jgi:hypothetical protein
MNAQYIINFLHSNFVDFLIQFPFSQVVSPWPGDNLHDRLAAARALSPRFLAEKRDKSVVSFHLARCIGTGLSQMHSQGLGWRYAILAPPQIFFLSSRSIASPFSSSISRDLSLPGRFHNRAGKFSNVLYDESCGLFKMSAFFPWRIDFFPSSICKIFLFDIHMLLFTFQISTLILARFPISWIRTRRRNAA